MVNPRWLLRNLRESYLVCRDVNSAIQRLAWLYSSPGDNGPRRRLLRLRYALPIGAVDILVRDNKGSDNFIVGEVFHHQYYEPHPRLQNVRSIVDLGANGGFTSVYWSKVFPLATQIAVEPHPDNAALARANCALNNVHAEIVQAACVPRDADGVRLSLHSKDYGHVVSSEHAPGTGFVNKDITVEGVSMPELLRTREIHEVDLLKVDIEGYEKVLLYENDAWLSRVRAMVIEWHFPDAEQELSALAAKHGFCPPERHRGQHWLLRP
jgi:FkbM family methyltransferase